MKSVTKSFTSLANGSDLGLTQAQVAGLYSVYIDGKLVHNGTDYPVNCMAYRSGGGDSNSASDNEKVAIFKGTAYYVAGYNVAYYNASVNASNGTARLNAGVGSFTGTMVFYYFG